MYIEGNTVSQAVVSTVAALIGMIPEGLVLLTSTVLAVSVIRLSQRKVLVQDLYCIETLARVDTLCLDKTGTITEGKMEVMAEVFVEDINISEIIGNINYNLGDNNPTAVALLDKYGKSDTFEIVDKKIMTVENLTSFNRIKKTNTFFIFLSGYHNSAKQIFLKTIFTQNSNKEYYHLKQSQIVYSKFV